VYDISVATFDIASADISQDMTVTVTLALSPRAGDWSEEIRSITKLYLDEGVSYDLAGVSSGMGLELSTKRAQLVEYWYHMDFSFLRAAGKDKGKRRPPSLYAELVRRMMDCDLIEWTLFEEVSCGLFFVIKKSTKYRLIVGGRLPSCHFRDSDPVPLASGAAFSAIEVDGGSPIQVGSVDIVNAFYSVQLPGPLRAPLILEGRVVVLAHLHKMRSLSNFGRRRLFLGGAMASVLAISTGRSSSKLMRIFKHIAGLNLAFGMLSCWRWLSAERNPAGRGSRRKASDCAEVGPAPGYCAAQTALLLAPQATPRIARCRRQIAARSMHGAYRLAQSKEVHLVDQSLAGPASSAGLLLLTAWKHFRRGLPA
ncbi:unnamed protein product, partial [Prorocentrum cordatum]